MLIHCSEVMRNEVKHVRAEASVQEIAQMMRDEMVGFLPICDEQDRVVGIVTDRDVTLRVVADGRSADRTRVDQIMSRDLISCRPGDALARAANLMQKHQKSRIVVTDEQGCLCGVISLTDVAQHMDPISLAALFRAVSSREFRMRSSRPPPPPHA